MDAMSRSDTKREQILQAAINEFQDRGFVGGSMDRIAAAADVSKRTVYNHFESKEGLFQAILAGAIEVARGIDIRYRPGEPLEPQLIELARAECELVQSEGYVRTIRVTLSELIRDPELAADLFERTEALPAFQQFMCDAAADGVIRAEDAEEASALLRDLVKAKTFWPAVFSRPLSDDIENIARSSVTTLLARFGKN